MIFYIFFQVGIFMFHASIYDILEVRSEYLGFYVTYFFLNLILRRIIFTWNRPKQIYLSLTVNKKIFMFTKNINQGRNIPRLDVWNSNPAKKKWNCQTHFFRVLKIIDYLKQYSIKFLFDVHVLLTNSYMLTCNKKTLKRHYIKMAIILGWQ